MPIKKRPVAAIVTEYRRHSHADVIVSKLLEGYLHDFKEYPSIELVSLYTDQTPKNDLSRQLARKYGFRLSPTIADAITLGSDRIAVDGVLLIGEHGKYPTNAKGQILYPRRRFMEETCKVFRQYKKSVPIFNDKHLSAEWQDAKWMYDTARELYIPMLAGSSIPYTWRKPNLTLPKGVELREAVALGYGPFEGYGFHALEGLQCMVERRAGGEVGVRAVQCLQGEAMWQAVDRGVVSRELLEAAIALAPAHARGDYRQITTKTADAAIWLIEYRDGFRAAVAMLNGYLYEGDGGAFAFVGRSDTPKKIYATHFYLQQPDPFAHFAELVKAIEFMIRTGHSPVPVERTLLTTGILDAVMTSLHEKHQRVETPHLAIRYSPSDWPHAQGPIPKVIQRP